MIELANPVTSMNDDVKSTKSLAVFVRTTFKSTTLLFFR